jgi:hypothetical protein
MTRSLDIHSDLRCTDPIVIAFGPRRCVASLGVFVLSPRRRVNVTQDPRRV